MPIILEDAAQTAAVATVQYSPKDYNSILTGNGINQGLLKSSMTALGTVDLTPNSVITTLINERAESNNKAHHVHDDVRSYTTLHQDISICGYYAQHTSTSVAPMHLLTDELLVIKDPATGIELKYMSHLFLRTLYVYKSINNYVLPSYVLVAAPVNANNIPIANSVKSVFYDPIYNQKGMPVRMTSPTSGSNNNSNFITDMYNKLVASIMQSFNSKSPTIIANNANTLAQADCAKSLYDIIMSELAIIKTPGVLKDTLTALSADNYNNLSYANEIMKNINIPFTLYQNDVLDIVNSRSLNEKTMLTNRNMSLSLANTLSAMANQTTAKIPELVGKKYTTNELTLTTEQLAAIEADSKVTIVAAGAGTGKSSCIIQRLHFMEENGCDLKQTHVLSFTKAAAKHIGNKFKSCTSTTIADFTHRFISDVILNDGSGTSVDIVSHSDFCQKLAIRAEDLRNANILQPSTQAALDSLVGDLCMAAINPEMLLDKFDINLNPEANNLISILKMLHCTSLEMDPIIFHSQINMLKPNIEHIIIDESQDSNRLEFLTILKMATLNDISIYIVGDCAQTLYEFRDADPQILNNLTMLFNTFDLSINHRSTQIILDVANLMSDTMTSHKTMLRANNVMQITKQAVDDTVTMNTYSKANDPATINVLDKYLERHLGQNETIAVIARSGNDVKKLYEYLNMKYGSQYVVTNITSQQRHDITILSTIGENLNVLFPATKAITSWAEFENTIRNENIRINSATRSTNRYNVNGPTVNKVTLDWLAEQQNDATQILVALNDPKTHDQEIRRLQMSLLDAQTEKNNKLQRVMDAKNSKLKNSKADIVVCTIHGVKGLEYDHVACFINTEATNSRSTSDENKRIAYVALTRAKQTECVFCTREKLLKDFIAYRDAQP